MIVYNTDTDKVENLVILAGNGNQSITIDFAYMQDTEPSNPQEKDIWFDTTNNKIYTYKNGQWTNPKDPQVGVFYLYNDEYYLWDGNSLEKTDLNIYEKIENKTDNFVEDSSVKYPSSKALSDGLKSVEPNLYDIKTLSQAVIDRGWTYLCNSTKQMLPKAKIPTVYEDIENKYFNSDKQLSDDFVQIAATSPYFMIALDDTYLYSGNSTDWKLKRTRLDNLPTTNWETFVEDEVMANQHICSLCVGEKILIAAFRGNNNATEMRVYRKSDKTLLKTYTTPYDTNFGANSFASKIWINGIMKFVVGYKEEQGNTCKLAIVEDKNIITDIIYTIPNAFSFSIPNWIGGNFVYNKKESSGSSYNTLVTTSDFVTFNNTRITSDYNNPEPILRAGNRLLACYSRISNDNGLTWQYASNIGITLPDNIKLSSACQRKDDFYFLRGLNNPNTITYTDDIFNFRNIYTWSSNHGSYVIVNNLSDMFFVQNGYSLEFLGYNKIVYTDNYTIGGVTVAIQYYKFNDWKICISDGGTNDTNLDTVYNGLGYENYWLLDRNNEQLCLPRNSNLYTQMYVGDDYEDITIPNGNFTRLLPQSNLITDMTSTSITFDSTNKVQPNTDYEYGELTSLTLDSSSIIDSKLGTTIKFQSGTTATVITDNSNIQWTDGAKPEPNASKTCLIFIWDNIGFYKEW